MKLLSCAVAIGSSIAAVATASVGACTSGDGAVSDDAGLTDATSATDARPRGDGGRSDASLPPSSGNGPEGWELFTDYDPACGIYYPTDVKYLPEPIRWEPCSVMEKGHGLPGPDGMDCRKMVLDAQSDTSSPLSLALGAEVIDGSVRIMLGLRVDKRSYRMVADADGPVHQALLLTGGCSVGGFQMGGGNYIFRVYDTDSTSSYWPGGAIGGSVNSLRPRAYLPKGHLPSIAFSQAYDVGRNYFIEAAGTGADPIYSMSSGLLIGKVVRAPEDTGMIYAGYHFQDDAIFWSGDSGARTAIKVWTLAGGVKTLVGWPGDNTRAAAAIAVDGVDMVWMEAEGRKGYSFARHDFWTAKYTTEPGVVEATRRHLLQNKLESGFEDFVVGCGYAAVAIHPTRTWGQGGGFIVIRLSDGMWWTVETESLEQRYDFELNRPLAVTCDEVIVKASTMGHTQLARVRLDSLGPGSLGEVAQ